MKKTTKTKAKVQTFTIGDRLENLRKEALELSFDLQAELDDLEEGGEDLESAVEFCRLLSELEGISKAVQSITYTHTQRGDSSYFTHAQEIRDELRAIDDAFTASGLKDEAFAESLEEIFGFGNEF